MRSDPYPSSPHDPPAAIAAANDSGLLDEARVSGAEAELTRRYARHGSRTINNCAKRNRSKRCGRECSLKHATSSVTFGGTEISVREHTLDHHS